MNPMLQPVDISVGETILFVLLAVSMSAVAFYGLLITRRAVYTIISVIFVMVCLAFLYTMLEAPFMGVAQVVVYTGAILMMFLFVLMLIGVDSADSAHETLRSQKIIAAVGGLGILGVIGGLMLTRYSSNMAGLKEANAQTNPVGVAKLIFSNHVLTLELTGTLLIVAALGAMTLTHRDAVKKRRTQEDLAKEKMLSFAAAGKSPCVLPNSGVYAESNSSVNPALTAFGRPLINSVNKVLRIRGQMRSVAEISPATAERIKRNDISGPATYGQIGRAQTAGMPGGAAPDYAAAEAEFNACGKLRARTEETSVSEVESAAEQSAKTKENE